MRIGMFESLVTQHWFNQAAKALWSDVATLQAWLEQFAAAEPRSPSRRAERW